jgi:hypothetical protein
MNFGTSNNDLRQIASVKPELVTTVSTSGWSRALAMRLSRIRFTIRTLFIAIAIGAIPMAFFRPEPRVGVLSL